MTRNDVVDNILIKIDEISPFSEPDEQFKLLIDGMLDDSANAFLRLIPLHLLRGMEHVLSTASLNTSSDSTDYTVNGLGVWDVPQSVNFLRMTRCICSQWRRPVIGMTPVSSSDYMKEFNRFTSSGCCKPRIYDDTSSQRRLILAPYNDNQQKNDIRLYYIPSIPKSDMEHDGANTYGIPDEILDAFFYYASAQVLATTQRNEFAELMMNKFNEYLLNRE